METKLIFQGNNLHNKIEEKKEPGKEAMVISYSHGLHQRADQGGFFFILDYQSSFLLLKLGVAMPSLLW